MDEGGRWTWAVPYLELEGRVKESEVLTERHEYHAMAEAAGPINGFGHILITHIREVVLGDGVAGVRREVG